jgi:hypothetical protein
MENLKVIQQEVPSLIGGWFAGKPTNSAVLTSQITNLAKSIVRTGAVDAKTAIQAAVDEVKKNSVNVNGDLVFGVDGIAPGDEKYINMAFEDIAKKHGGVLDIDGPEDLTINAGPDGQGLIINKVTRMPVLIPEMDAKGNVTSARPATLNNADLARLRTVEAQQKIDEAADIAVGRRGSKRTIPDWFVQTGP